MADLHLISVEVSARRLVEDAQRRGQLLREIDTGYLLHAWLEGTFGPGRLRPFVIDYHDEGKVRVLGYAPADAAQLAQDASTFATPDHWAAADWASLRAKPMPASWAQGQRLGFRVRVCPVVRQSAPEGTLALRGGGLREGQPQPPGKAPGHEVDAWLAACRRSPEAPAPDRSAVYADWLRAALERSHGATLESAELVSFQLSALFRRTQGQIRKPHPVNFPDATLRGTLTVADPTAFSALLARGVGRHRAFGFGMLLLEPPR